MNIAFTPKIIYKSKIKKGSLVMDSNSALITWEIILSLLRMTENKWKKKDNHNICIKLND
jgi:hypothetical protein